MILIIPCAGESTRFSTSRPKWLLTQPSGLLMVTESVLALDLNEVERIIVVCRRDHVTGVDLDEVADSFRLAGVNAHVEFSILDAPTASQPETVSLVARSLERSTPIFIKDCDNSFSCKIQPGNIVCLGDASKLKHDIESKSYCRVGPHGEIETIAEKRVISDRFCVGGYGFERAGDFIDAFDQIKSQPNIYISHIIDWMMMSGERFMSQICDHYMDWGTMAAWMSHKKKYATLFVDIDGVVLTNGSAYFERKWRDSTPLGDNVKVLRALSESGRCQIIYTTARPEALREVTVRQLRDAGLTPDNLIMGLLHAHRRIINDHSATNPYPSCTSVSVSRDAEELRSFMSDILDDNDAGAVFDK